MTFARGWRGVWIPCAWVVFCLIQTMAVGERPSLSHSLLPSLVPLSARATLARERSNSFQRENRKPFVDELTKHALCLEVSHFDPENFSFFDQHKIAPNQKCGFEAFNTVYRLRAGLSLDAPLPEPISETRFRELDIAMTKLTDPQRLERIRAMPLEQVYALVRHCYGAPADKDLDYGYHFDGNPSGLDEYSSSKSARRWKSVLKHRPSKIQVAPLCGLAQDFLTLPPPFLANSDSLRDIGLPARGMLWLDYLDQEHQLKGFIPVGQLAARGLVDQGNSLSSSDVERATREQLDVLLADMQKRVGPKDYSQSKGIADHFPAFRDDVTNPTKRRWFTPAIHPETGAIKIVPTEEMKRMQALQGASLGTHLEGQLGRYRGRFGLPSYPESAEAALALSLYKGNSDPHALATRTSENHALQSCESPFEMVLTKGLLRAEVFRQAAGAGQALWNKHGFSEFGKNGDKPRQLSPTAVFCNLRKGNVQYFERGKDKSGPAKEVVSALPPPPPVEVLTLHLPTTMQLELFKTQALYKKFPGYAGIRWTLTAMGRGDLAENEAFLHDLTRLAQAYETTESVHWLARVEDVSSKWGLNEKQRIGLFGAAQTPLVTAMRSNPDAERVVDFAVRLSDEKNMSGRVKDLMSLLDAHRLAVLGGQSESIDLALAKVIDYAVARGIRDEEMLKGFLESQPQVKNNPGERVRVHSLVTAKLAKATAPEPRVPTYAAPEPRVPTYAAPEPRVPTYAAPEPRVPTHTAPPARAATRYPSVNEVQGDVFSIENVISVPLPGGSAAEIQEARRRGATYFGYDRSGNLVFFSGEKKAPPVAYPSAREAKGSLLSLGRTTQIHYPGGSAAEVAQAKAAGCVYFAYIDGRVVFYRQ